MPEKQAKEQEGETFEKVLERAESIARQLEEGSLSLDESLAKYEEGVKALKRCYEILRKAEKRIEILVKDEEGNLRAQPFDTGEGNEDG